jgi:DNA-binding transcriptional LysR family regulator
VSDNHVGMGKAYEGIPRPKSLRGPDVWAEQVDLTDLQCMLVVAEEQSITRAAARLYLSQPALSRRIRRLERSIGSALFLRHSRSVSLTPAGAALAEQARVVIVAAAVALQRARAVGVRVGGDQLGVGGWPR